MLEVMKEFLKSSNGSRPLCSCIQNCWADSLSDCWQDAFYTTPLHNINHLEDHSSRSETRMLRQLIARHWFETLDFVHRRVLRHQMQMGQ